MNQLDSFLKTVMDQAVSEAPDDPFSSVDAMVSFADRAGGIAMREFVKWQPKQAKVIQMPTRPKRRPKA